VLGRKHDRRGGKPWMGLIDTIRSWWRTDRIRVSPVEGQLLRLPPGSIISFEGQPIEISQRQVEPQESGKRIRYVCQTPAGIAELSVDTNADAEFHLTWNEDGNVRPISHDEITVWRHGSSDSTWRRNTWRRNTWSA